jgi:hypothetical protein
VFLAVSALLLTKLFAGGRPGVTSVHLVLLGLAAGAAIYGQMYVAYRNSLRTRPRSRKEYLLGSLGFGVLTLVSLMAVGLASEHHLSWLADGLLAATVWCFVYTFALLARCVLRGGLRRAFWAIPPWWALNGASSDRTAPAAPAATMSLSAQSRARVLPAPGAVDHGAGAAFIREQPLHQSHAAGRQHRKAAGTARYEIICIACGDDPDRDYSDVPAEIQQVRGPYPTFAAARDALRQHLKLTANR